jgi:hypothetical protein
MSLSETDEAAKLMMTAKGKVKPKKKREKPFPLALML